MHWRLYRDRRMEVGAYLRACRTTRRLTRPTVALAIQQACANGINACHVFRIERGEVKVSAEVLFAFVRAVGADLQVIDELYQAQEPLREGGCVFNNALALPASHPVVE